MQQLAEIVRQRRTKEIEEEGVHAAVYDKIGEQWGPTLLNMSS